MLVFGALACTGGREFPTPTAVPVSVVQPLVAPGTFVPDSTATPWPTFTPMPVPTDATSGVLIQDSVPGGTGEAPSGVLVTGVGTPEPEVVVLPSPTPGRVALSTVTPVPAAPGVTVYPTVVTAGATQVIVPGTTPGPGPTPYGRLVPPGDDGVGEVRFAHQTLFALQRPEIPLAFRTGIIEDLPGSASFVSQTSRFVIWVVVFDVSDAVPGWSMDGYVRWYNVNRGFDPLLMMERDVSVTHEAFMFFEGLGTELPGFWRPGQYKVQYLNEDYEEVVSWEFDVR